MPIAPCRPAVTNVASGKELCGCYPDHTLEMSAQRDALPSRESDDGDSFSATPRHSARLIATCKPKPCSKPSST
jgi:hypothetical protein